MIFLKMIKIKTIFLFIIATATLQSTHAQMILLEKSKSTFEELIDQDGLVLVEFFSNGCVYCRMIEQELRLIANNNPDITVVKVDVRRHGQLSGKYRIGGLPTLVYFKNGQLIKKALGYVKAPVIQKMLDIFLFL